MFAPKDSHELALAYSNRSAFLFHIKKFKHCLKDIDRALLIKISIPTRIKLICRKAKCSAILGSNEGINILRETTELMNNIQEHESKKLLFNLINQAKSFFKRFTSYIAAEDDQKFKVLERLNQSSKSSDSVDIKYTKKYGRHLIARKDLKPGEIIFEEKIYAHCTSPRKMHSHCCNCQQVCWSGIPCESCTWAIFCSEDCLEQAKIHHDIECTLMEFLLKYDKHQVYEYHLTIRLLILGLKEAGSIHKLKTNLQAVNKNEGIKLIYKFIKKFIFELIMNSFLKNSNLI